MIYPITGHCAGIIINKPRGVNHPEQKTYEVGRILTAPGMFSVLA
jgi:hypothetical protein